MRILMPLFFSFLLAACYAGGKRGSDMAMAIYDLGLHGEQSGNTGAKTSMALEVRAPLWFDSLGISYRLAYAEPARLREYGRARWAGPPSQLIQRRLMRDLGRIPAGQGKTACLLRLEIDEFSQTFDTADRSRAVMKGAAQWMNRSRSMLWEQAIHIEVTAVSPDAKGGVAALTAAVEQLTAAIETWEQEPAAATRLAVCYS